jgi:hypothetical protein
MCALVIQKDLEILTLIVTNITKITKFHHLNIWNQQDCIELMRWHIKHERHYKKGINNNISLVNHNINVGESSYSLLNFKLELFVPATLVICPFKAYSDVRGIIRLSTTFHSLKTHSRLFDRNGNELLGESRDNIINLLVSRIISGFDWSGNCTNYSIRRYRLNWILSCPKFDIDRNIDIHHKNGLQSILDPSQSTITDDRFNNLTSLRRDVHRTIHFLNGDNDFIDM